MRKDVLGSRGQSGKMQGKEWNNEVTSRCAYHPALNKFVCTSSVLGLKRDKENGNWCPLDVLDDAQRRLTSCIKHGLVW